MTNHKRLRRLVEELSAKEAEVALARLQQEGEAAGEPRVRDDNGAHGIRFVSDTDEQLDADQVRELMERGRR